jgi:flagellin-like hook-associated protein FlgL
MREALVGLRSLHADNSVNDTLMSATTLSHQTSINMTRNESDRIELIDPNEVAIKVQSAQTQLQAIFAVTGTASRLSLVNFLA